MPGSSKNYWNKHFSHVYVEEAALAYPLTAQVLAQLRDAVVVPIGHYKDVFNRPGQDFDVQKHSQKLILAVRSDKFLLPGARVCDHYGHDRFFYATQMMNCPYHCEYCYLRGMYASGHIVAFVNTADYTDAVRAALPAYVSISYDTDLLAMEPLFHYVSAWLALAAAEPTLTLEVRTKSTGFHALAPLTPVPNMILAWTLSPEKDAACYERKAPKPEQRLKALRDAVNAGWPVRLCIDPVLLIAGWEERLAELTEAVKAAVDVKRLYDISIGGFRISKTYYKRMRRLQPGSFIFSLPLVEQDGVMAYLPADEARIRSWLLERLHS